MAKIIQLPDGHRINLDRVADYSASGHTISFVVDSALTLSYADSTNSDANAEFALSQIDKAAMGSSLFTEIPVSRYRILSIDPASFDILTGQLTILGSGFVADLVGTLRIEDEAGIDSNGYWMNCTFVDETTLTAVYGGAGDSVLAPTMYLAYKDSEGAISNLITGSNPSGTLITIP